MDLLQYTHLLWDFNGTVFDDVEACRQSVNHMLGERDLPLLSLEDYREVFDFPVSAYYARVGFNFSREPFEVLAPIWVAEYHIRSRESVVFADVREAMSRIRAMGIRQEILSATEAAMLEGQIRALGLDRDVDGWNGMETIHAAGKESLALAWRAAHPEARVLFVGDTTHDAHVAAMMGADCVLFDRGHMSRARLSACGLPIIHDFAELFASDSTIG